LRPADDTIYDRVLLQYAIDMMKKMVSKNKPIMTSAASGTVIIISGDRFGFAFPTSPAASIRINTIKIRMPNNMLTARVVGFNSARLLNSDAAPRNKVPSVSWKINTTSHDMPI
jgi:hypothetical protein